MADEIRICTSHRAERPTPLIWTFAFMGAEYWCPWCGRNYGMLGAGVEVEATPELLKNAESDKAASHEYLHAKSSLACSRLKWEGEWIEPSALPQHEKDRIKAVCKAWVYPAERATTLSATGRGTNG